MTKDTEAHEHVCGADEREATLKHGEKGRQEDALKVKAIAARSVGVPGREI